MKKRYVWLLAGLTAVMLAGCGAAEETASGMESVAETVAASSEVSSAAESSEAVKEIDAKEVYEQFLAGNEKVYTEKYEGYRYDYNGDEVAYYTANDGYTLDDFLGVTLEIEKDVNGMQQIDSVEYQLIDCGADGTPELLLQVNLTVDEFFPQERQYVMKVLENKLQLTYQNESNPYTQETIGSDTGAITTYSMYSYDYWYEGSAYLDAQGKFRSVNTCLVNMFSPASNVLDARFAEAVNENAEELQEVYVRVYRIGELPEDEDDTVDSTLYYCGEKTEDEPSNGYDFDENVRLLQEVFNQSGEKLYSMAEILEMTADREKAIGVSDAVRHGQPLQFTALEMKDAWREPVINEDLDYGDDCDEWDVVSLYLYSPDVQICAEEDGYRFFSEIELTESTDVYILDEDTYFGTDAAQWFEGYEEGDTPMSWVARMLESQEEYPTALVGVFEMTVCGNHIDSLDGCYWWD